MFILEHTVSTFVIKTENVCMHVWIFYEMLKIKYNKIKFLLQKKGNLIKIFAYTYDLV